MSFVNVFCVVLVITLNVSEDISRRRNGAYRFFEAQSWFFCHEGNLFLNLTNSGENFLGGGVGRTY